MTKYYVRTNEGAYLKSHAEFTHYWTKKRDDAEELSMMEAMKVMDHNNGHMIHYSVHSNQKNQSKLMT